MFASRSECRGGPSGPPAVLAALVVFLGGVAQGGERTGVVVRNPEELKSAAFLNPGWVRVEAGEAGAVEAVLSALPPGTSALVTVEAARAGELAANFRGRVAAWQLGQRFEPSPAAAAALRRAAGAVRAADPGARIVLPPVDLGVLAITLSPERGRRGRRSRRARRAVVTRTMTRAYGAAFQVCRGAFDVAAIRLEHTASSVPERVAWLKALLAEQRAVPAGGIWATAVGGLDKRSFDGDEASIVRLPEHREVAERWQARDVAEKVSLAYAGGVEKVFYGSVISADAGDRMALVGPRGIRPAGRALARLWERVGAFVTAERLTLPAGAAGVRFVLPDQKTVMVAWAEGTPLDVEVPAPGASKVSRLPDREEEGEPVPERMTFQDGVVKVRLTRTCLLIE